MNSAPTSPRPYTMTARARSVAQTRSRILDAAVTLYGEQPVAEIGLEAIAARAEVSVQTVLRHFGSRENLVEAAFEHARDAVVEERRAPVGDPDAAVRTIVDHYETRGDAVLVLLGQEHTEELARRITEPGRAMHRAWVEDVFAPFLDLPAEQAETAVDLLVVATDVYTWKLLRRDRGLTRAATEARTSRLVAAVLADLSGPSPAPLPEPPVT